MIATAVTLALFALVGRTISSIMRQDGAKIVAALQGRSVASRAPARPVMVRFSAPEAAEPRLEWRAAA